MAGSAVSIQEYVAFINRYIDEGFTDGLPIIPPYEEGIEQMVAGSGRHGEDVVGTVPIRNVPITVRDVAINALMAGCLPSYMPVVLAALEVMLERSYNWSALATSTKGCAPLVIINGPIRHRIGINCRGNALGPGWRANATIGRTLRLVMLNLGGVVPGKVDRSTFGHGGKYTYVLGEDEEGSPWPPLHVDLGFEPTDSTVTVMSCEAPRQVGNFASREPERILRSLVDTMSTLQSFRYSGPTEAVFILGPEHASLIAAGGWTKDQVREFLFRNCGRPARDLRAVDSTYPNLTPEHEDDDFIPLFEAPEHIKIVCAGGSGRLSLVCQGFGAVRLMRSGTRKIIPG